MRAPRACRAVPAATRPRSRSPRRRRPSADAGARRHDRVAPRRRPGDARSSAGSPRSPRRSSLSVAATSLLVGSARRRPARRPGPRPSRTSRRSRRATLDGHRGAGRRARRPRPSPPDADDAGRLLFSPSTHRARGRRDRPDRARRRPGVPLLGRRRRAAPARSARCSSAATWPTGSGRRRPSPGSTSGATFGVSLVEVGSATGPPIRCSVGALLTPAASGLASSARPSGIGRIVGRRRVEIGPVEQRAGGRRLRADVVAVLAQDGRQPGRLARPLDRVDVRLAPARVHHDEPDQPGSDDEPDDEQPPVELGVHRRGV